jgi:hypothetical protein
MPRRMDICPSILQKLYHTAGRHRLAYFSKETVSAKVAKTANSVPITVNSKIMIK